MLGLGVAITVAQAASLAAHLDLVAEANASFNLTAVPIQDYVPLHVLDSVVALPFLSSAPEGEFVDLGSGAGFPGVPLAILSGRPVTFVESVKKKAGFLERVVATLCLKATVQGIRAEELGLVRRASFAAVTARAVSSLPSLVELAAPLLVDGGLLICLKGAPDESEIARGDSVGKRCGMTRVETAPVTVPRVDATRTIVVYRRQGPMRLALPRRNGLAQRQPLA